VDQGLLPACVRGCPGNARVFGDLNDPNSEISRIIRGRNVFRLMAELDTQPKVFYIMPARKEGKGGIHYEKQV
jgi:molybdopterin-containing oxidoreductase family iron-sulfur binding subunit